MIAPDVVACGDMAREIVSAALSLRESAGIRIRVPLPKLTICGAGVRYLTEWAAIIADAANVRHVELIDVLPGHDGPLVAFEATPKG